MKGSLHKVQWFQDILEEDLDLAQESLKLTQECDKVKGMGQAWIRIRLGMLQGCKWMAFMRVGELVAKLSQYG